MNPSVASNAHNGIITFFDNMNELIVGIQLKCDWIVCKLQLQAVAFKFLPPSGLCSSESRIQTSKEVTFTLHYISRTTHNHCYAFHVCVSILDSIHFHIICCNCNLIFDQIKNKSIITYNYKRKYIQQFYSKKHVRSTYICSIIHRVQW